MAEAVDDNCGTSMIPIAPLWSAGQTRLSAIHWAALSLIVASAMFLRWQGLTQQSLWVDEIASLEMACGWPLNSFGVPPGQVVHEPPSLTSSKESRPLSGVIEALRDDTHPPLYYLILRFCRATLGDQDSVSRGLSATCSIIGLLLLFDIARLLHGTSIALWAAAIMAVATPQIQFSHEVRNYMMMLMWGLAGASALVRMQVYGVNYTRRIAFTLALLCGLLTHYHFIAPLAALIVYALISGRDKRVRNAALLSIGIAIVLFAALDTRLLIAQQDHFKGNTRWLGDPPDKIVGRTVFRVISAPIELFILPMTNAVWLQPFSFLLLLIPILMLPWRRDLLLWVLLAGATLGLVASQDLVNKTHALGFMRYKVAAGPGLYALGAAMLANRRGVLRHVVPATLLISCIAGISQASEKEIAQDWRGFAQRLSTTIGPDDLMVFYRRDDRDWYQPILHAGLTHYAKLDTRPVMVLLKQATPEQQEAIKRAPHAWLINGSLNPPLDRFVQGAQVHRSVNGPMVGTATEITFDAPATTASAQPETPHSP